MIHKQQRGDTIVEVLLAMAVVGVVLGSSFGIANRSLNIGRSAQERTMALKIAESQLELMKAINKNVPINETSDFCIKSSSNIVGAGDNACNDVDGDGGDGLYTVSITPPSVQEAYEIKVSWIRLGAGNDTPENNEDNLTLYYKLGAL